MLELKPPIFFKSTVGFQNQIHAPPPLSRVSLERDLTEKSHKTSFKGHNEIACLSSTTSSFLSLPHLTPLPPPPPPPPLLLVHLQAIPLRVCKIASIWMDCQRPGGGGSSQDGPSTTVPTSLWFLLTKLLPPGPSSLSPCAICAPPTLWVMFPPEPLWSESIRQAWPRGTAPPPPPGEANRE